MHKPAAPLEHGCLDEKSKSDFYLKRVVEKMLEESVNSSGMAFAVSEPTWIEKRANKLPLPKYEPGSVFWQDWQSQVRGAVKRLQATGCVDSRGVRTWFGELCCNLATLSP